MTTTTYVVHDKSQGVLHSRSIPLAERLDFPSRGPTLHTTGTSSGKRAGGPSRQADQKTQAGRLTWMGGSSRPDPACGWMPLSLQHSPPTSDWTNNGERARDLEAPASTPGRRGALEELGGCETDTGAWGAARAASQWHLTTYLSAALRSRRALARLVLSPSVPPSQPSFENTFPAPFCSSHVSLFCRQSTTRAGHFGRARGRKVKEKKKKKKNRPGIQLVRLSSPAGVVVPPPYVDIVLPALVFPAPSLFALGCSPSRSAIVHCCGHFSTRFSPDLSLLSKPGKSVGLSRHLPIKPR